MNEEQARAATPPEELERRVMDVNIAKSETEWWAKSEISRLRAEREKGREALEEIWEVASSYEVNDSAARGWIEVHARARLADTERRETEEG